MGLAVTVLFAVASSCIAATPSNGDNWVTAWAAAMLRSPVPANAVRPETIAAGAVSNQTVREMVIVSVGGSRVRIRLSNRFGRNALDIQAAGLARAGTTLGSAVPGTQQRLRFGGHRMIVIPPGAVRYSDPVSMSLNGGETLAVTLFVHGSITPTTWHPDARRMNAISPPGDHVGDVVMPVARRTGAWLWLSGVEVERHTPVPALVVLGDSITNGFQSTIGRADGYPHALARRLRGLDPLCQIAVLNEGIDGNEISSRDGNYGPGASMVQRFDRDVLQQAGVRYVLLLGGINDIGEPTMALRAKGQVLDAKLTAKRIINAQERIVAKARTAGLRVIGATLPPFGGTLGAYSAGGEQAREQVNHWIRHYPGFAAVADFDKALRDPSDPTRLAPRYDSGDHIHPDDAGYAVMANAVPLAPLGCAE